MKQVSAVALMALLASTSAAQNSPQPGLYADIQMLWFDSPIRDENLGSDVRDDSGLTEFAPRFIIGYDDDLGARIRWWTFERNTTLLGGSFTSTDVRQTFDVVDLEATTHVRWAASDILLSGGARIAHIDRFEHYLGGNFDIEQKATLYGITLAGEGRTKIYAHDLWGAAFVYGGRFSVLEGDWGGSMSRSVFIMPPPFPQNERFIVPEVFTGLEGNYGRAFTRLTVEMQDWTG